MSTKWYRQNLGNKIETKEIEKCKRSGKKEKRIVGEKRTRNFSFLRKYVKKKFGGDK